MAQLPIDTAFPVDEKGVSPRDGLPSPVVSTQERGQPSRFRRVLSWILVVSTIVFIAHRCERQLYAPLQEPSPSETAVADQVVKVEEKAQAAIQTNQLPGTPPPAARIHHRPVIFDRTFIYPTDETCPDEWVADTHQSSPFATPIGERHFRATSRFALRQDVQTYVVDSESFSEAQNVHVHVVPGLEEHATVNVDAFYDDVAALDLFYPCTYRADETEELISEQSWTMPGPNGTTTTSADQYDLSDLQKSDLLRFRTRRSINQDGNGHEVNAWYNVTLAIPSSEQAYSLHLRSNDFVVDLHAGLALAKARVNGGRIFAHEGFTARELDVNSYNEEVHGGVFGHFSASGNVSIGAMNAPIDVYIETTHSLLYQAQTVNLHTYAAPLKATLSLVDLSTETGHNSFKVIATSREGPLDLTLRNGSTYAALSIDAETMNAPAHLTLDTAFEGTFVAKSVESAESEVASAIYTHGDPYSEHMRVFRTPFETRHIHAGAVGWGSEEAAVNGASFAEVRSVQHSAHINI